MLVLALARPHSPAVAHGSDGRGCGCAALFSRTHRRGSSMPQSPLSAGPGSGRRHYPEEFAQIADLGVDRFDKRSAAEMERDFPAMVRAGGPWQVDDNTAQQLPVGVELFAMDLGPTSGRRVRPPVAAPDYQPHWLDGSR